MAKKMFSENAQVILRWMQKYGEATAEEIAEGTGLNKKTVNGVITAALQRKNLAARKEVEDKEQKVCYLTNAGFMADPDAEVEE